MSEDSPNRIPETFSFSVSASGSDALVGVNIHYCATCDGLFYKGKNVFVVGGGNSAFEESLFLKRLVNRVTILVRRDEASADPIFQEKVEKTDGIEVWLNSEIIEFKGEDALEKVIIRHKDRDEIAEYKPDGIFVFIGMSPNTKFLEGLVELDERKFVLTNRDFQSSARGIYAAGDCRKGASRQAVSAAGEGATAALMIREYLKSV
ncbi:MAG: NAD(P)/FAD-dependent oxidoreductase [Candidatus Hermodarchaeota archaeon]